MKNKVLLSFFLLPLSLWSDEVNAVTDVTTADTYNWLIILSIPLIIFVSISLARHGKKGWGWIISGIVLVVILAVFRILLLLIMSSLRRRRRRGWSLLISSNGGFCDDFCDDYCDDDSYGGGAWGSW
jgi:hypothetical protein